MKKIQQTKASNQEMIDFFSQECYIFELYSKKTDAKWKTNLN
jgi:hypothetical protein